MTKCQQALVDGGGLFKTSEAKADEPDECGKNLTMSSLFLGVLKLCQFRDVQSDI